MRLLALLLLLSASVLGQVKQFQLWLIPNAADTTTGQLSFSGLAGSGAITLRAPNTVSGNYVLVLPAADGAGCLQSNGSGVLSFLPCGGSAPLTLTADSVFASSNPQLRIRGATDTNKQLWIGMDTSTTAGYIQAQLVGTGYRDLLLQQAGGKVCIGCTSTRTLLTVDGAIDNAPSGGTTQYALLRNLRLADYAGSTSYWDFAVLATGATSELSIRDNGGAPAITFRRVFASTPTDEADVYVDLLPDANESQSLGASGREWLKVWAKDAALSGDLSVGGAVTVTGSSFSTIPRLTVTTQLSPGLSGTGYVGTSSLSFGEGWITAFYTRNLTVTKDIANTSELTSHIVIRGNSNTNETLSLGFHTTDNYGWIQANDFGTAPRVLVLQPNGGSVCVACTTGSYKFRINGTVYADDAIGTASSATNALGAAAGGVTAKWLIGTTSLSLAGDSAANAGLSGAGQGRIYFDSTSKKFRVSMDGGAYADLATGSTSQWVTTGSDIYYNTGGVAIGTTSIPASYKMLVRTGTNQNFQIRPNAYGTGAGVLFQASNDADSASVPMEFGASSFSFNVGSVGIGTVSPGYRLEVNGTVRAAGATTLSSTLAVTGGITGAASIDVAPSGGTTQYAALRDIRMVDRSGGTSYWLWETYANGTTSSVDLKDTGGTSAIKIVRIIGGGSDSYADVALDWLPSTHQSRTLGDSGREWLKVWAKDAAFSGDISVGGAVTVTGSSFSTIPRLTVTTQLSPGLSGTGYVGTSSYVFGEAHFSQLYLTSNLYAAGYTISTGEIATLDGIASNIQSQLNAKPNLTGTNSWIGTQNITGNVTIASGYDLIVNGGDLELHGAVIAPSGSVGLGGTVSCGSGQAIKSITVSGGIVTAASCGIP